MDIKIRFANRDDLESCVELDLHKNIQVIQNKIDMNEVIICETNNSIIGCLKIEYFWTHLPFISYIVVKDGFRTFGIGSKLLAFLENYLKEKGCTTLLSSTMTDAVTPQRWHMKKGFEECGMLCGINDHGVGEIFYKKNL